jgi:hypothetical protein
MKRLRNLPLLCAWTLALGAGASAAAEKPFEGVVTFRLRGDSPMTMRHLVKGARTRIEYAQMPSHLLLVDRRAGTTVMLSPESKEYLVSEAHDPQAEPQPWPRVAATGRKETIAGHPCEHFMVGEGDYAMDYCVARGLGHDSVAMPEGAAAPGAWEELVKRYPDGFFALSAALGSDTASPIMVATLIERTELADALFVTPADYKEQQTRPE